MVVPALLLRREPEGRPERQQRIAHQPAIANSSFPCFFIGSRKHLDAPRQDATNCIYDAPARLNKRRRLVGAEIPADTPLWLLDEFHCPQP